MTVFREISVIEVPVDVETTGTISATGQTVVLGVPAGSSNWIVLATGTWSGELHFETSVDTINWDARPGIISNTGNTSATFITSNATVRGGVAGFAWFHVIAQNWVSGTATITIRIGQGVGPVIVGAPLPNGTNTIGNVGINGTVPVSISSPVGGGSVLVAVQNWQNPQPVSISSPSPVTVNGTVNVGNFPGTQAVSISSPNPLPVSGTVSISGTVPVSGTVGISGTVPVSGTVTATVSNFPATQAVSGTVSISGTVPVSIAGTVAVSIAGLVRTQTQAGYYASTTGGATFYSATSGVVSISVVGGITGLNLLVLLNPAASGKTLYISRTTIAAVGILATTTVGYVARRFGVTAVGVGTGTAVTPVNRQAGSANTSIATVRSYNAGTPITTTGTLATEGITYLNAIVPPEDHDGSIVLPAGQGLIWQATVPAVLGLTMGFTVDVEWWEI